MVADNSKPQLPKEFALNDEKLAVPSDVAPLFQPYKLGDMGTLTHRIVYAPLTRSRSPGNIPQEAAIEYYTQRASKGGYMLTEGSIVAPEGHGYLNVPGIWRDEEREAWKPIVAAVKAKGAVFAMQLWHTGRASHSQLQPNGTAPIGPSAIPVPEDFQFFSGKEMLPYPVPREMTIEDIKQAVEYFRKGARNAIDAGFDGVEIHGANGYLLEQFLRDSINKRTDEYGGPIENRARFVLEVVNAVVKEVGAQKVGIRLSPFGSFLGPLDSNPYTSTIYLLEQFNKMPEKLAYVHLVEGRVVGNMDGGDKAEYSLVPFRKVFKGTFIAAGGFKVDSASEAVATDRADLVCFGRWFLANPDLPKRFLLKAPLNQYDRDTFYSPGMKGYIDYPFLTEEQIAEAKAKLEAAN